jgi:hypothetical protein
VRRLTPTRNPEAVDDSSDDNDDDIRHVQHQVDSRVSHGNHLVRHSARPWQCEGQGFESPQLHQNVLMRNPTFLERSGFHFPGPVSSPAVNPS